MQYMTLITIKQLAEKISGGALNARIIDCSFDLNDPEHGYTCYVNHHIPGAFYLHLDQQLSGAKTNSNGRHPLPERSDFLKLLSELSITEDTQLICYDNSGGMYAARLWWLCRWVGHASVAVLDGGIDAWTNAGFPLQNTLPPRQEPSALPDRPSLVTTVNFAEVLANIDSAEKVVIDARSPERYRGENENMDSLAGHIPDAKNRFFRDNLNSEGYFKSPAQLRDEFVHITRTESGEDLIAQCGSGVTACHNLLALEIAGLTGAALYPGSWSEWSKQDRAPIETGSE